ncbi:MAG TPA: hypothetical protein VFL30_05990 [Rhodanobacteraceae bacterium]|nr:hypothetical protein [Rhodanobacteraceae bacterium]
MRTGCPTGIWISFAVVSAFDGSSLRQRAFHHHWLPVISIVSAGGVGGAFTTASTRAVQTSAATSTTVEIATPI